MPKVKGQHFVYYNLHKHKWSVRNWDTKLVEEHLDRIVLFDCKLKVYQSGRERVLKEQRKNVHAGVLGKIFEKGDRVFMHDGFEEITYNPYKYDSFVRRICGTPVDSADVVIMYDSKVFAKGIKNKEIV